MKPRRSRSAPGALPLRAGRAFATAVIAAAAIAGCSDAGESGDAGSEADSQAEYPSQPSLEDVAGCAETQGFEPGKPTLDSDTGEGTLDADSPDGAPITIMSYASAAVTAKSFRNLGAARSVNLAVAPSERFIVKSTRPISVDLTSALEDCLGEPYPDPEKPRDLPQSQTVAECVSWNGFDAVLAPLNPFSPVRSTGSGGKRISIDFHTGDSSVEAKAAGVTKSKGVVTSITVSGFVIASESVPSADELERLGECLGEPPEPYAEPDRSGEAVRVIGNPTVTQAIAECLEDREFEEVSIDPAATEPNISAEGTDGTRVSIVPVSTRAQANAFDELFTPSEPEADISADGLTVVVHAEKLVGETLAGVEACTDRGKVLGDGDADQPDDPKAQSA